MTWLSLWSREQQNLLPSTPTKGTNLKENTQLNPYLMHKAVQNSTVRIVGPFTQLGFGTYSLEDLQIEIKRIHDEMEPESVENDFKEMRARKPDFPSSVAKADHNIKKNRSLRAIPYDTNRVVLNSTDPVDDYLNASPLVSCSECQCHQSRLSRHLVPAVRCSELDLRG